MTWVSCPFVSGPAWTEYIEGLLKRCRWVSSPGLQAKKIKGRTREEKISRWQKSQVFRQGNSKMDLMRSDKRVDVSLVVVWCGVCANVPLSTGVARCPNHILEAKICYY